MHIPAFHGTGGGIDFGKTIPVVPVYGFKVPCHIKGITIFCQNGNVVITVSARKVRRCKTCMQGTRDGGNGRKIPGIHAVYFFDSFPGKVNSIARNQHGINSRKITRYYRVPVINKPCVKIDTGYLITRP